jgi:hypothetical protein
MAEITQINMDAAVKGWADVAIQRFKEALTKQGVEEYSRDLLESLVAELSRSGGDIEKVIIKFKGYGRFVDMGVGRGVAKGEKGSKAFGKYRQDNGKLKKYGRKSKPWYSKTKTREVAILRELLVTQYKVNTLAEIENGLTFKTTETLS